MLLIAGALIGILADILLRTINLWRCVHDWETNASAFLKQYNNIQNMPNEISEDNPLASTFNLCVEKWAQSVVLPTDLAAQNVRNACKTNTAQWLDRLHRDLHYFDGAATLASDLSAIGAILHTASALGGTDLVAHVTNSLVILGAGMIISAISRQAWHYFLEKIEWWDRRVVGFTQKILDDLSYSANNN
jgi:hypothetical protein